MSVQAAALDLSIALTGHEAQDSAGESRGVQRRDRQTPSLPFHQMPGLERGAEDPIGNRTRRLADSDDVQGSGDTHRLQLVPPDRLCCRSLSPAAHCAAASPSVWISLWLLLPSLPSLSWRATPQGGAEKEGLSWPCA